MKKLISVIVLLILAGGAYYLISPYFIDQEVNDEFPDLDLSSLDLQKAKDAVMEKTKDLTMDDIKNMVQLPDQEMIDKMTDEARESVERSILDKMSGFPEVEVDEEMQDAMSEEAKQSSDEPVLLKSGAFVDADNFHRGSGEAHVVELPDGQRIVRFEDFRVTNGPDLFVWLVKDLDNVKDDYVNLGRLKGNVGNQNYELSGDVNIDEYEGVVIWCRAFSVLFSPASFG